jgi:hypothetical protein
MGAKKRSNQSSEFDYGFTAPTSGIMVVPASEYVSDVEKNPMGGDLVIDPELVGAHEIGHALGHLEGLTYSVEGFPPVGAGLEEGPITGHGESLIMQGQGFGGGDIMAAHYGLLGFDIKSRVICHIARYHGLCEDLQACCDMPFPYRVKPYISNGGPPPGGSRIRLERLRSPPRIETGTGMEFDAAREVE